MTTLRPDGKLTDSSLDSGARISVRHVAALRVGGRARTTRTRTRSGPRIPWTVIPAGTVVEVRARDGALVIVCWQDALGGPIEWEAVVGDLEAVSTP